MADETKEPKVNPWPGGAKERKAYVEALETEREGLSSRPQDATRDRRIGEIEEQLDSFSGSPKRRTRETPESGTGGRPGRARTAKKAAAAETPES